MSKILVVVDMQNDFITGSLGTAEAREIVPRAAEKINNFGGRIILTKDTHKEDYLNTQEGRSLPVEHCIEGTRGHDICDELKGFKSIEKAAVYEKGTFGSYTLAEALKEEHERTGQLEEIELCGLCTDICVVSNALIIKAYLPEVKVAVDSSCCAGVTPEKHKAALEVMRSCQIEVR